MRMDVRIADNSGGQAVTAVRASLGSAPMSSDAALAREVAGAAGDLLLRMRPDLVAESDLEAAGRSADSAAHLMIAALLDAARPDDVLLSEEAPDDPSRHERPRVWIVDPLDGTREYVQAGRSDWAVHVALWAGGALVEGAVGLPAQGLVLGADEPPAVPARSAPSSDSPIRVVVSRSRPPELIAPLVVALRASGVELEVARHGSAGGKAAEVILGHADAYLHDGGLHEWDTAAPVAVAVAAGLHVSHLDGTPLAFNTTDAMTSDLLLCRTEVAAPLLSALASLVGGA